MTLTQWLLFFLVVQVLHFLGTWRLYIKAGRKAWEAAIPVYNAVVLMKIINRPWWWVILLFIPIVNLIMIPVVWVETIRSFGRNSTMETFLVILTFGLYIFYVNYALDVKYIEDRSLKPRSAAGEWISSILFAIIAATLVHTYLIQPFTIPTSSLEKTLLVGDFLFVSKFHYGARTPMTAVAFPMVHDTIPGIGVKSYLERPQIPYFRLPGFQNVERNDIVVFNWPVDTMVNMYFTDKYYYKPIDKKTNYVKRAVAIPGDSLEIINGKIHINSQPLELPDRAKLQYSYQGTTKGQPFNPRYLYERYNITDAYGYNSATNTFRINLTEEAYEKFRNHPNVETIYRVIDSSSVGYDDIFPLNTDHSWNIDNMGPLFIPKKGTTVPVTTENYNLYKRIIEVYEGNEIEENNSLTINGNQVLLNGQPIEAYTFRQDYYWMMGDNRHNSVDSRYFGFVPETHIVGKPVLVWLSIDANASGFNKIRWDRMFTTVGGSGEPISYLPYILIVVVIIIAFNFFKKRRES